MEISEEKKVSRSEALAFVDTMDWAGLRRYLAEFGLPELEIPKTRLMPTWKKREALILLVKSRVFALFNALEMPETNGLIGIPPPPPSLEEKTPKAQPRLSRIGERMAI